MASTPAPRARTWLVPVLLLLAVVVAVLLVVRDPGDEAGAPAAGPSSPSSAAPTVADPDTWCTAFRSFAEAQALAVAAPEDPAAQQSLRDAADALLGLGRPLGLSEAGQASLEELVGGTLGEPPTPAAGPSPDPQARDDYLAASCPA